MKKSLIVFAGLALIATVAMAVSGTSQPVEASVDSSLAANELLGITPFWIDVTTGAFCPPGGSAYPCTSNFDCDVYYGLNNYICSNPSGARCGGNCIPC